MEEKIRLGNLFDFYGELLGEHQRRICEASLMEDLSLAEIADEMEMSRQGVHNHLVRAGKALEEYESKLHLYDKFVAIRTCVEEIEDLAASRKEEAYDRISLLSEKILEEL